MKIVIQGAGEVGSHLAKMLSHEANEITVIDDNAERLAALTAIADISTILSPPSSIKGMRDADVPHADLFISVVPFVPQEVNIVSALLAKNLGASKVTARISDNNYLATENKILFKQMGIELMFYPERLAADEICDLLKHSSSVESMDFARGKLQIEAFRLEEDSPLLDMKIAEFAAITSKADLQFRVIAITRGSKTIMPKFDTKLLYHDLVFIVATKEGIAFLSKFLGHSTVEIDSVMILGGSRIAELTALQLSSKISRVTILEKDRETAIKLSGKLAGKNVQVVIGDGRNTDFLVEEGIKDYDAFVALTKNDEANVLACVMAKRFGIRRTVAEVENIEYIRLAEEMGVDNVINKKLITASRIFKFTLSGRARFVRYMTSTNAEVIEYTVAPGSAITNGPLKSVEFPRNAIIAGVVRGSEAFIAVGDTCIEAYDRVAIFALPETIREIDKVFK